MQTFFDSIYLAKEKYIEQLNEQKKCEEVDLIKENYISLLVSCHSSKVG
jgi:hypothetical protein